LKDTTLIIGSAQFGMHYGVSNTCGTTKEESVSSILNIANYNGISLVDTAPSYGNSEIVLGRGEIDEQWNFITKTPSFSVDKISRNETKKLKSIFAESCKRVNKKKLYGLLVHSCDDLFKPGGSDIFREMESIKEKGLVEKIGVSVYSSYQIEKVLKNFPIDLIQLPINILDQRLLRNDYLKKLKEAGIEIHARSAFLQGLLLMDSKDISPYFDPILSALYRFHNSARQDNLSKLELALGFVNSIDEIDNTIIGVNNLEQLNECISASRVVIDTNRYKSLSISDPMFLNPQYWKI
jgi:aryl-alcohol dehydrogenase-like predicted oxidoreductase